MSPVIFAHSVAVVITADSNNPSVLNPDFLRLNKIVGEGWTVLETLTTLAVSQVRYQNNLAITVEPQRVMVTEELNSDFLSKSLVHDVAMKYAKTLPHVPYKAVGLNAKVSCLVENPDAFLVRFLSEEIRRECGDKLDAFVPKFVFKEPDFVLNLTLTPGTAQHSVTAGHRPAVLADINFHHDVKAGVESIEAIMGSWIVRRNYARDTLVRLLGDKA